MLERPGITTRVDAWRLAERCAVVLVLLVGARIAGPVLVPVLLAAVLCLLFGARGVRGLATAGSGLAGAAALALAPLAALAFVALLLSDAGPRWLREFDSARAAAASFLDRIAMQSGVDPARDAAREAAAWFRSADGQSIRSFFREQGAAGAIVVTESAVLLFFMRLSLAPVGRRLAAVLPARRCARLRLLARDVRRGVLGYLVVMVAMNAGLAAALALSLAAFDVAQPLVWAGAVFALVFIPYLGPLAAVGLLLVVGAARFGPTAAMAAPAAAFLLLHGIEANLISPWFTARKLQTSRVAVLVAVLAGTWAWGVVGGLLAMPLLIAAQLALARTNSSPVLSALLEADLAS